MNKEKQSFLKNHADTIAIIGVNLAIAALLLSIILTNMSNINAVNARIDNTIILIYDEMKDFHNHMKDFHGRLCQIEERNKNK